jgi:hypothetical protein
MKVSKEITGFLAYVIAAREMKCSSPHEKCLLLYFACNCNDKGKFFKSQSETVLETGLSERFIRKTIKDWENLRWLRYRPGDLFGAATEYTLDLKMLQKLAGQSREYNQEAKYLKRQEAAARIRKWRANRKTRVVAAPDAVTERVSSQPTERAARALEF